MKKIIAIILCFVTVLSLTACKQNGDAPATTEQDVTTQMTTTVATTVDATTETEPEETVQKDTTSTQPKPTVPSIQKLSQKKQFETLAGVVGLSLFDAVEKLGWKESQMKEMETCLYSMPLEVYLDGTKYQVLFGVSENTGKVSEVLYRAELPFQSLEVARVALKTVDIVDQWVGKDNQLEADGSFTLRDTTEVDVSAGLFLDEFAYSMVSWDYSKQAKKTQTEFIKECGEGVAFGVFLEVSRACLKEGDKVISDTCLIDFSVGAIPAP